MYSQTNSQALGADGQVLFRQVTINGASYWQASNGRTFPVVAGAEDPPVDEHSDGKDGPPGEDDSDATQTDPKIARLRHEAAETRIKLREATAALDALRAEEQKRKDAEKSEVERLRDQLAETERKREETERQHKDALVQQAIERAATKLGAADPEDVYRLLEKSLFELDSTGQLTNAEKLVAELLKKKPYLAGKASNGNGVPGTPARNGQPQTHDERVEENKKKLRATGVYRPL